MSSELRFVVRRVGIGVASTCKDSAALNTCMQALLHEGKALEMFQAVLVCGTAIRQIDVSFQPSVFDNRVKY